MPMSPQTSSLSKNPHSVLAVGQLLSTIWESGNDQAIWKYRFNICRVNASNGHISHLLRPADIPDLVRLSELLAVVLAEDSCIPADQQGILADLATKLDEIHQSSRYGNQVERRLF